MITLTLGKYAPGIHKNMPFSEYAAIKAVNKSSLLHMQHSPEDCLASLEGRYHKDSTGFAVGSALDDLMTSNMTPDQWSAAHPVASNCQAMIDSKKSKNYGKPCGCEAKNRYGDQWLCGKHAPDEAPTAVASLTGSDMVAIKGMKDAILESDCNLLFQGMKGSQIVVLWHDKETGLPCKARLDGWSACQLPGSESVQSVHFDLKSTRCDTVHSFERDANSLGYWLQMSHYLNGCATLDESAGREPVERRFMFAVACSQPNGPLGRHDAYLWEYDAATLQQAEQERAHLMRKLKSCLDAGHFPPKKIQGVQTGTAPEWNFTFNREQQ